MSSTNTIGNFEKSLLELENIVNKMEQGELSLEQSLDSFEKGVQLTKQCQSLLKNAEQRVSKLIENNDNIELQKFNQDDQS